MASTVTVGLIPAPELAEKLVGQVADELPDLLANDVATAGPWDVEVHLDPLVGAGGSTEVLEEAEKQRRQRGWDLAVAVTDLPLRGGDSVIVADISTASGVAVISLPALGVFRLQRRLRQAVISAVRDLVEADNDEGREQRSDGSTLITAGKPAGTVNAPLNDMSSRDITVRYAIPRIRGHIKLVTGMVRANQPWQVFGAFKGALAATFATAAYALIFPSVWRLAAWMGIARPLAIMLLSVTVMVVWIIVAHNLWERPTKGSQGVDTGLIRLYNTVTACTLVSITAFGYAVLFVGIFAVTWLFMPMPYFAKEVSVASPAIGDYLDTTWLIASLAMVAAALGQGLDDDETVRRATFGYRQSLRARRQQKEEESESPQK